jgi:hypothetical protein
VIEILVPLRLGRGGNDRMHWRAKNRQKKAEQEAVFLFLRGSPPSPPLAVTLTRLAPSAGLDDDNLSGSCKAVRDQVAKWLGVDDKDPRVKYRYQQQRAPWGVRINIEAA